MGFLVVSMVGPGREGCGVNPQREGGEVSLDWTA